MTNTAVEPIEAIVAKDTWNYEDYQALIRHLYSQSDAVDKFRSILAQLEQANPQPSGAAALKVGVARYMLCRFRPALEALAQATDNKDNHYFQAMCHKSLGRFDKAADEFRKAQSRGWNEQAAAVRIAECQALAGQSDAAEASLKGLDAKLAGDAEYRYVRGLVCELRGFHDQAVESYEKARQIQPNHGEATFRLAYFSDLHGDEATAAELYQECLSQPPVHANALLNMSVLLEDDGQYDRAIACLKRLLAADPNHGRAKLFLKDVEASKDMYYDEDQAKRIARRNAVLDIPVTDFELSVRARNCLKKMNIRTLGDLVRTSEAELLGYKNFGETSLKEIKDMLSAKGLRLGQALEEGAELAIPEVPPPPPPSQDAGAMAIPLDQIELSVRARKALETLNVNTLGDLTQHSENELLACRNFGQTSLNEVRERLAEYGLRLRES